VPGLQSDGVGSLLLGDYHYHSLLCCGGELLRYRVLYTFICRRCLVVPTFRYSFVLHTCPLLYLFHLLFCLLHSFICSADTTIVGYLHWVDSSFVPVLLLFFVLCYVRLPDLPFRWSFVVVLRLGRCILVNRFVIVRFISRWFVRSSMGVTFSGGPCRFVLLVLVITDELFAVDRFHLPFGWLWFVMTVVYVTCSGDWAAGAVLLAVALTLSTLLFFDCSPLLCWYADDDCSLICCCCRCCGDQFLPDHWWIPVPDLLSRSVITSSCGIPCRLEL